MIIIHTIYSKTGPNQKGKILASCYMPTKTDYPINTSYVQSLWNTTRAAHIQMRISNIYTKGKYQKKTGLESSRTYGTMKKS